MVSLPLTLKIVGVIVLAGFMPLTGLSYYLFRRRQRQIEIERIFDKLNIDDESRQSYSVTGWHFVLAVSFATAISLLGLTTLFLGYEFGIARHPTLPLAGARLIILADSVAGDLLNYQQGALLVFGMAFLGAYLWGLQSVFRRYAMGDLTPATYYNMGVRMIFAAIIAVLIYHAVDALAGGLELLPKESGQPAGTSPTPHTTVSMLPALAFLLGLFPQRGVQWLTKRVTLFSEETDPAVEMLPLEMIQGVEQQDRMRLEELGIETCYDLATADFIPLMIKTPYGAREVVDWILQAKLCVYFGRGVIDLRRHGFRTIVDLIGLDTPTIDQLAKETQLTVSSLTRATKMVEADQDIQRLRECGRLLGEYWNRHNAPAVPPAAGDIQVKETQTEPPSPVSDLLRRT
jgi:hypothetical protein